MKIDTRITRAIDQGNGMRAECLTSGLEHLAEFADRVETVEQTLDELAGVVGDSNAKSLQRLRKQLAEFEPSVTLLGQVKSGKTALVSALAGWPDLLPSDVNPWTSVVTSLHVRPGTEHPEIAARFRFVSEEEWDRLILKGGRIGELAGRAGAESDLKRIQSQIEHMREKSRRRLGRQFELLMGQTHEYEHFDKNLLERYICLGDDFEVDAEHHDETVQGQFADITRSADLYLNSPTLPFRMCLRDTPGVNDTFMMREQVTIGAIRESKVCVVVLSASQALTTVDMGLIRLISNIDTREIIIFVNRIDELTNPVSQIPEIEASVRETLRTHLEVDDVEVLFGSAYWANKALAGEIDALGDKSATALLNWAEFSIEPDFDTRTPQEMVWELSGLPALLRSISSRVVDKVGERFLQKTAMSAMNVATAQQAANTVQIDANDPSSSCDRQDLKLEFERVFQLNLRALENEIEAILSDFRDRADRAHATFVTTASQSLVKQLERYGSETFWECNVLRECNPESLRILLRSAYRVMGTRIQSTAKARYETAVSEIAHLLHAGFGDVVEGIQIGVPNPADIPPPAMLGQTIALDFNDSWWASWWRRMRGQRAMANHFEKLITSETQDLMGQLKFEQTEAIKTDAANILRAFLDEQRDILMELMTRPSNTSGVQDLFLTETEVAKRTTIEKSLSVFQPIAA
ncbi:dynamin family protein [Marimonas sp. MJW-29]|uniref:Dynamin family protein n=1 Tax=Sulfitobacter sediminis TaxID=3234186 RepID=A0ABV3RVM0_9RHOB